MYKMARTVRVVFGLFVLFTSHRSNNTSLPLNEWAFVRKPLAGSSRHLSQKRNSSFFSANGFLPFTEEPGISLYKTTTDKVSLVSFDDLVMFIPKRLNSMFAHALIPCWRPFVNKVYSLVSAAFM